MDTKQFKHLSILFLFSVLIISCGRSSKEKTPSTFSKIKAVTKAVSHQSKNVSKLKSTFEDAQKLTELEPMDQSLLKEWLPKTVENHTRTLYKTGDLSVMGTTSFNSRFADRDNDKKTIDFDLVDGAGSFAATTIAGFNHTLGLDQEEETEHSYKKTVEKQGYTAVEEQNDLTHTARLSFVHKGRFLITLEGHQQTAEELWSFVRALPLHQLK